MDLSQSDIQRVAAFVRKITKVSEVEVVVSETFATLNAIVNVDRMRLVYWSSPSGWTEWKAEKDRLEICAHANWRVPEKKSVTVSFDDDNVHSGFISADPRSAKMRSALEIMAPGLWSVLSLRWALTRVQKSAVSETELVRATLRARDEERRRIARDLHDDLGQSLALLKLTLKWAEDLAATRKEMCDVVKELSAARQDVGAMIEKVRDLSHTLYPRILDTLGLVGAVKELAHQVSRSSTMTVECRTRGRARKLGKDVDVSLYRCCQESINNAVRHAGASKLVIGIHFAPKEVRVSVEDDGRGFDPRTLYESNSRMMSSGFWTIRQRMADLGAAFRVSTSEGHGTVVELIVPYHSRKVHDKRKDKATPRR